MQRNTPIFSYSTINHSNSTKTKSNGIETEAETLKDNRDSQLISSTWNTEFAIAELEQQNRSLSIEMNNLKVSLKRANRSRENAKADANRAEFKLGIS